MSTNNRMATSPGDDFFIGWLPTPTSYASFLRSIAILALVAAATTAGVVTGFQRDPGPAQWETDEERTFDGVAFAEPYPMLRVSSTQSSDGPRTFLLVESGKLGARDRVRAVAGDQGEGKPVRARGAVLHRDGRWMLELMEGEDGMRALAGVPTPRPARQQVSAQVTLSGEIIDPKCYLGAMKPGGGKTHKACAALCISGGIPPMFVTRDANNRETFYLLATPNGGPANEMVLPFVGDHVSVTGRLEKMDDLLILYATPNGITRR